MPSTKTKESTQRKKKLEKEKKEQALQNKNETTVLYNVVH